MESGDQRAAEQAGEENHPTDVCSAFGDEPRRTLLPVLYCPPPMPIGSDDDHIWSDDDDDNVPDLAESRLSWYRQPQPAPEFGRRCGHGGGDELTMVVLVAATTSLMRLPAARRVM